MKKILLLTGILFVSTLAYADIVRNGPFLMSSTGLTAGSTNTGNEFSLVGKPGSFILRVTGTRTAGAGTMDARVEHSPVCGTLASWKTLESFTQQNAAGPTVEDIHINHLNTNVYPCVRTVVVIGAGAGTLWDVDVKITHD